MSHHAVQTKEKQFGRYDHVLDRIVDSLIIGDSAAAGHIAREGMEEV
jgi:hypothetical protein